MTARNVDFSRNASTPRSMSRGTAAADVSVCSVVSTRWPVSAAWIGDVGGLGIAHLADHDHVGILAHEGAHRRGESQADRGLHLRLIDAGDLVFDRVFDGQDLARSAR